MRVKRCYNNLLGSILMTSEMIFPGALAGTLIYFADTFRETLAMSILLGFFIIVPGFCIIWGNGYEYWGVDDTAVYSKKLFRRKVTIAFDRIESVENTVVHQVPSFQSEAFLIRGDNKKIIITKMNKKKTLIIEELLKPYMKSETPQTDIPGK